MNSVWMQWRWFSLKTGQWSFAILQRTAQKAPSFMRGMNGPTFCGAWAWGVC